MPEASVKAKADEYEKKAECLLKTQAERVRLERLAVAVQLGLDESAFFSCPHCGWRLAVVSTRAEHG